MSRFVATGLAFLLLVAAAGASAAGLTVVTQSRTVSGDATAVAGGESGNDGDSAAAPGNGHFREARNGSVYLSDAIGSGGGFQDSWILEHALRAEGTHFSNAEVWGASGWSDAAGATRFEVTFEIAAPTGYTVDGWVEEFDNGNSRVTLDGPGGSVHAFYPPHNDTLFFTETGTLAAGTYTLEAVSSGSSFATSGWFDYSSGAFDFDFVLDGATDAPVVAAGSPAAYPNPFRAATRLTVPEGARALKVFDAGGRLVRTLEGQAAVRWDGRNESGGAVPAGVYFVRVEGSAADPVKLVRLR